MMQRPYMTKGKYMLFASEITTSIHQSAHARVAARGPQAGTHTKQTMLIIVARPMGNVPKHGQNHHRDNTPRCSARRPTEKERLRRVI